MFSLDNPNEAARPITIPRDPTDLDKEDPGERAKRESRAMAKSGNLKSHSRLNASTARTKAMKLQIKRFAETTNALLDPDPER